MLCRTDIAAQQLWFCEYLGFLKRKFHTEERLESAFLLRYTNVEK